MTPDLVVTTELVIAGYPPEDLVLKRSFVAAIRAQVETLAAETADGGPALVVGAPWHEANDGPDDKPLNAILLLDGGAIAAIGFKQELPNYGVFDEQRVFRPGLPALPVAFRGVKLGLSVCEDIWVPEVCAAHQAAGAELHIVINGSPFDRDKADRRFAIAGERVHETKLPLIYVNQVGGQDELVFDGGSFILNGDGRMVASAPAFVNDLLISHWRRDEDGGLVCRRGAVHPPPERYDAIYNAIVLGLRDYVSKNGFPGIVLGLSGGIDSALTAAVAVDALGAARVHCVLLPSPYTSQESLEDAAQTAARLGGKLDTVSIEPAMEAFAAMLAPLYADGLKGVTAENIQARARGLALMAISNQTGAMLLTTGNKSEMSVGYATIYGDMNGGFSVLKDIYKTDVFGLAKWRNENTPRLALDPPAEIGDGPIPVRVIEKPPSAELRPDQTDQDSLPPYHLLDDMLQGLIEHDLGVADLIEQGHDAETALKVWRMLERAEYKRRQAPPGVKITARAFGRGRRYPMTNAYRDPS